MRARERLLATTMGLLTVLLGFGLPAIATADTAPRVGSAHLAGTALTTSTSSQTGPGAAPRADQSPTATAPPGPSLHDRQQEADRRTAANKLIIGVIAVVLLVIVFFGRRSRRKYLRKLRNLQNAKT